MKETDTKNIGLRGVKVADTRISDVNGEKGVLIYRGYNITDLARSSTYEEVSFLLLNDHLPGKKELEKYRSELVSERGVPEAVLDSLKVTPKLAHPMDVLQAAIPFLASFDSQLRMETREANYKKAIRLIAKFPTVVAAWDRIRNGFDSVSPNPELSHAGNFLSMLKGTPPDPETARDFDICLILHAEHSLNASTFAGREVASTHAHIYAAVAAAMGALSGELHGGANSEVMKMLLEIGELSRVKPWVSEKLSRGGKIMGMGHAVYKTTDPRGKILKEMGSRLSKKLGQERLYQLSGQLEKAAVEEFQKRGLSAIKPNVDFFSAPVYHMMGIPGDLMTPIFAISRIAGWCAHIIEEEFAEAQERPALYRPQAEYVGHYCGLMGCTYVPVEKRT